MKRPILGCNAQLGADGPLHGIRLRRSKAGLSRIADVEAGTDRGRSTRREGSILSAHALYEQKMQTSEGRAMIVKVKGLIVRSEYKRRQAVPIIRVRGRAFESGRQMPIAAIH